MDIKIYNERRTSRADGPPTVSFLNEEGKVLTRLHFEWLKDPGIPIIQINLRDDYNANRDFGQSQGFGDVRKWIADYDDNVENEKVHIIFKYDSINILFDNEAIMCAFKMTFGENKRIIFGDSF